MRKILSFVSILTIMCVLMSVLSIASAETVTKHIDFSNLTDDELNSVCSDTYKDFTYESTDSGIKFTRVDGENSLSFSHCTIKISDYIDQFTKDIVINELTLDTISIGNFNLGIKFKNSSMPYWLDTTSVYSAQFRNRTYLDFSILGTYIPNYGSMAGGSSGSPIIIDETNLKDVTHIIFYTLNVNSNITVNGLNFLGEPITTTTVPPVTISPTTIPGQTVSVDELVTDSFSIFSLFDKDYFVLLISFVSVFVVIDVVLIFFKRVTK